MLTGKTVISSSSNGDVSTSHATTCSFVSLSLLLSPSSFLSMFMRRKCHPTNTAKHHCFLVAAIIFFKKVAPFIYVSQDVRISRFWVLCRNVLLFVCNSAMVGARSSSTHKLKLQCVGRVHVCVCVCICMWPTIIF